MFFNNEMNDQNLNVSKWDTRYNLMSEQRKGNWFTLPPTGFLHKVERRCLVYKGEDHWHNVDSRMFVLTMSQRRLRDGNYGRTFSVRWWILRFGKQLCPFKRLRDSGESQVVNLQVNGLFFNLGLLYVFISFGNLSFVVP